MAWNAVARMLIGQARQQMGGRGARDASGEPGVTTINKGLMVRDPVCGLHLPESRALSEVRGGERFHFCSDACLQSFRKAS